MDMLSKVEALFRMAVDESVTPAEAKAHKDKAEKLLIKYSIDRALINLKDKSASEDKIILKIVTISNPYRMDKILLLGSIASAFGCRCAYLAETVSLVGYESDIESVKFLYVTLQLQAIGSLIEAEFEDEPEGNLVTYRKSFFLGFTREVGDRLSKYTKAAVSETTGAEVAIYDRKQAVDSEYGRLFPVTQNTSIRRGSSGLRSGTAAGKKADIGITKVGPQGRRAIGG